MATWSSAVLVFLGVLFVSCGDGADVPVPLTTALVSPGASATATPTKAGTPTPMPPRPTQVPLAPLDPCSVVSVDEARALTGRPMSAGQRVNFPGSLGWADCSFAATSGQARVVVSVSNVSQDARGLVDSLKAVQGGGEARGVSGLGDLAFTNDRAVAVLKGQRGVQFLVVPAPQDTNALLALVRAVLARVP